MPVFFNIADWYWTVAGSTTQVYSSAVGDYVPTGNAAYQTWLGINGAASRIVSEADLGTVLAASIDALTTKTSTVLVIQQDLRQAQLDQLLVQKADNVKMVQGGQSSTTTGTGVANYLSASTNNYRTLRAQIAAATTPAQVRAIDINAGWPANP